MNDQDHTTEENNTVEQTILTEEPRTVQFNQEPKENKTRKKKKGMITFLIVLILILLGILTFLMLKENKTNDSDSKDTQITNEKDTKSEYRMLGNSLEKFDLSFLKLENEKVNKIYSPISIKYALRMLADGADGDTKTQLESIIGDYQTKSYSNNSNMAFANAIFVNETYKNSIQQDYIDELKNTYGADVVFDSFETEENINKWVKDHTLNLIDGILDSKPSSTEKFILLNALGIDMEWEEKFILWPENGINTSYEHENFSWYAADYLSKLKFNNEQTVSGMEIIASFNNYDIVNVLGEESIRKTVGDEYRKFIAENPSSFDFELTEENINNEVNSYLDTYIKEIDSQYKREDKTTDFSFYTDDNTKVFAKDLKEYNGTTLQYVAIMPTTENLDTYISNTDYSKINTLINNLKELKVDNFKDGVVTVVRGFIPKFKFDYNLDLMNDLETLGVTDVFDIDKANLSKLIKSDEKAYVDTVKHKANIEFTQDGIKAAAVTAIGGAGAVGAFNYWYDVPIEEIDLTFDKPYMFIIRDKETGEVWFTGTVYNPLDSSEEQDKLNDYVDKKYVPEKQ